MSIRSRFLLSLGCVIATSPALAAPLVTYTFNGIENNFNTTATNGGNHAAFAPSSTAAGLTATNLSATGGGTTTGVRLGNNKLTYAQPLQDAVLLVGTAGTGAFSETEYFSFTLTPEAGKVLDLETITVQGARGGGSDRGFRVKSSVDGFTAALNDASTELIATQRPTLTDYTIDLTDSAFDALTTPIEFRVYAYSSAKDNTVELDNLIVNGEVLVPEPGSMALIGLGSLVILRRRAVSKH